jgi:hypothetical protein
MGLLYHRGTVDHHPPILAGAVSGSAFICWYSLSFRGSLASLESVAIGVVQSMGRVRLQAHLRVQSPALLLAA